MTTYANQITIPVMQFFQANGSPLSGGKLFFYTTGTTTKLSIYSNASLTAALPNPIILDAYGRVSNGTVVTGVYWAANTLGKVVLAPSTDTDPPTNAFWTIDPVYGIPEIDLSSYFTATSSSVLTLNAGITLSIAGTLGGLTSILDSNGNTILNFTTTASAVNYINITDAASGSPPIIAAAGSDTNVGLTLNQKGAANIVLGTTGSTGVQLGVDQPILDSSGNPYIAFSKATSAVNEINITNAATGTGPTISAAGTDTSIGLTLDTKGASTLNLGTTNATTVNVGTVSAATVNVGTTGASTNTIGTSTATTKINQTIIPTAQGTVGQHIRIGTTAGTLTFKTGVHFENVVTFLTSGTWTVPSDVALCEIHMWGAGGGGGGCSADAGGGGGGGAYVRKLATVTPGGSVTVTVSNTGGAGGAAGAANTGTTGTSTVCSGGGLAATLTAAGGVGGTGNSAGASVAGGAGGTATNGDLNFPGQPGWPSSANAIGWGKGGSSPQGGQGAPNTGAAGAGTAGTFPGGGGSGASGSNVGGAGGAGYVVIYY